MIPVRSDVRIWLATGCTDMSRGMFGLALQVLKRDPHAGDLYIFPGRRGDLMKVLWHDGIGMSLYASGSTAGGSSGRRQPTAWWRSRRRRWRVCWK